MKPLSGFATGAGADATGCHWSDGVDAIDEAEPVPSAAGRHAPAATRSPAAAAVTVFLAVLILENPSVLTVEEGPPYKEVKQWEAILSMVLTKFVKDVSLVVSHQWRCSQ